MHNTPKFAVTTRALAVHNNELLMCKLKPEHDFYCLPGGKLEVGESLADCMTRELTEETGIRPEIGKFLIINDWVGAADHRIEFFFWIRNAADFRHADPAKASHGHELTSLIFADATDPQFNLMPEFLRQEFPRLVELGENYPAQLIRSFD